MKKILNYRLLGRMLLLAVAFGLFMVARQSQASPPAGYTLVWSDEFSSTVNNATGSPDLNETVGAPPDPAFWSYDLGAGGWGNNELETYTTSTANSSIVTDANAPNGTALYITAINSGGSYSSARIRTQNSTVTGTTPLYGYFESAIAHPAGSGLWPAWWMMGTDNPVVGWPECGEMDLFEMFEANPTNEFADFFEGTGSNEASWGGNTTVVQGPYNTYAILWTPSLISNYYNGTDYRDSTPDAGGNGWAFSHPFFFIYNMAVGGNPGAVSGTTPFPSSLKIGYLRVYQSASSSSSSGGSTSPGVALVSGGSYNLTPEDAPGENVTDLISDTGNGNSIILWGSNGTAAQTWTFNSTSVTPAGDYNAAVIGAFCLSTTGTTTGSRAILWACNGSAGESWNVVPDASPTGFYTMTPSNGLGLCLDASAGRTDNGTLIDVETCDADPGQQWAFTTGAATVPSAPTLSASAYGADAQVTLSWSEVANATSYNIYRSTASGQEALYLTNITGQAYSDTGLTDGTTYYYTVAAVNTAGTSVPSNEVSATPAVPTPPATPTGLTTLPGNAEVLLSWNPSSGATSYALYRSSTSGGEGSVPYQTMTGTGYTDTGLSNGTTYYYTVASVNAIGTSAQSGEVTGTPNGDIAINAGGGATGIFIADTDYSGGTTTAVATTISTAGLVNPAPMSVYQSNRYGNMTYTVPGLTVGASYEVRLHFAETYWTSAGSREFNVLINGTQVMTNFDIFAAAGGENIGTIQQFLTTANGSGNVVIQFANGAADNAQINGIEVYQNAGPIVPNAPTGLAAIGGNGKVSLSWNVTTGATSYNLYRSVVSGGEGSIPYESGSLNSFSDTGLTNGTVYYYQVAAVNSVGTSGKSAQVPGTPSAAAGNNAVQICCGSNGPVSPFIADTYVSGGGHGSNSTHAIDTTAVTNPAPVKVYQGNHNGTFTYTIPGENPGEAYTVRLHFAELFFNAANSRTFNVSINGTQVLTHFDIWATAGAEYKANIQQFTTNANAGGQVVITFTTVINNGQCNGLEVIPVTPTAPTGLTATAGNANVALNWSTVASAATYNVYRSTTSGGEGSTPLTTSLPTPAYTDTAAANGTTYYYTVAAVNAGGTSPQSNEASATPVAPGPTVATAASATPNPVTGTTTALSVLGAYSGGESALTYTWSATGPAAVTYSANGTNAAKNATATFTQAGSYNITASISDGVDAPVTSSVTVTVNQTLTSIAVSPTPLTLNLGGTQTFSATANDQFGAALSTQPTFAWSVDGGGVGSIDAGSGAYSAGLTPGTATVRATSGGVSGTAAVTVVDPGPSVATAASATPNPVSATTTALSVLGADLAGEATLTYTWSATGPATVTYSDNGDNTAKNTTATFTAAGTYNFTVTINNTNGGSTTSSVSVTVDQTLTSIAVSPSSVTLDIYGGDTFSAIAYDQFGNAMGTQPTFTWSVDGGGVGSIDPSSAIYTAGTTPGSATVRATSGGVSGTSAVTVVDPGPTVATAASATPNPVTGTTTALSVLGADLAGESSLTYTWSATGPAAVTYSDNGDNTAKNATATFTAAGTYNFTVTIANAYGGTITSSVSVTVNQTYTSVSLTPGPTVAMNTTGSQQFTAKALDQFGNALASQPAFIWSLAPGSVGSITDTAGLYHSGTVAGTATVKAKSGGLSATVAVTVSLTPVTIVNAAAASPNPVTGTTTRLTVLGGYAGTGGAGSLTYNWSATLDGPDGVLAPAVAVVSPVSFSDNNDNTAKNTTATFTQAGTYTFTVTITSPVGSTATSSVNVTVNPTLTSIVVTPGPTLTLGPPLPQSQQFSAVADDQFGNALATQPTFTWSLAPGGVGSISVSGGLYHSGAVAGTATVRAKSGTVMGTTAVTAN